MYRDITGKGKVYIKGVDTPFDGRIDVDYSLGMVAVDMEGHTIVVDIENVLFFDYTSWSLTGWAYRDYHIKGMGDK